MILSKSCIYGIQAVIYVAAQGNVDYVPISQIAEKLNLSFHFLTKILQGLTSKGYMLSYRGPRGGVALAKPASHISLYDLINAIDGHDIFTECMLGLPGCGKEEPCPAHEQWSELRIRLANIAKTTSLAALAAKSTQLNVRLANILPMQK